MTLDQYVSMVTRVGTGKFVEERGGGEGVREHTVSNGSERELRARLIHIFQGHNQNISSRESAGTATYNNTDAPATLTSSNLEFKFHSLGLFFGPDRSFMIRITPTIAARPPCQAYTILV